MGSSTNIATVIVTGTREAEYFSWCNSITSSRQVLGAVEVATMGLLRQIWPTKQTVKNYGFLGNLDFSMSSLGTHPWEFQQTRYGPPDSLSIYVRAVRKGATSVIPEMPLALRPQYICFLFPQVTKSVMGWALFSSPHHSMWKSNNWSFLAFMGLSNFTINAEW